MHKGFLLPCLSDMRGVAPTFGSTLIQRGVVSFPVNRMTRVIPNVPFYVAVVSLVLWTVCSLFVVIPVHPSNTLLSLTLVYIGSYVSVFTKKVIGGGWHSLPRMTR